MRRLGQTRPLRNTPTNGSNGERGKEGAASFPHSEWDSGDGTGENKVCLAVGEITPVTYATAAVDSMTHTACSLLSQRARICIHTATGITNLQVTAQLHTVAHPSDGSTYSNVDSPRL